MARRGGKGDTQMDTDGFMAWMKASDAVDEMQAATGETGGPVVSMTPRPLHLPMEIEPDSFEVIPNAHPGAIAFDPQASRLQQGWTAERQMIFIERLAETGTVHAASKSSGLSARSAYRLRARSARFAAAWDAAQQLAVGRLSTLVFDRAINGRVEQVFTGGDEVLERRVPSDRLLMWLLVRLDPKRFAAPWERRADDLSDPQAEARAAFPALLDQLTDTLDGDFAEVRRQCDSCDSSPPPQLDEPQPQEAPKSLKII